MGVIISKWISEMIKHGVTEEHIENMKGKVLGSTYPYEYYYDEDKRDDYPALVDTTKIEGIDTGWITAGRTVFDLFFSITGEIPKTASHPLHYSRIKTNIESLINNGVSYQHHFYINKDNENILRDGLPEFRYFIDDDIYFSGATHRTISALMFNAPKMIGYITTYKRNNTKFTNYILYKQVVEMWAHVIDNELKFIKLKRVPRNEHRIGRHDKYELVVDNLSDLYLMEIDDPIIKPYKIDLNSKESILIFKKNTYDLMNKLKEIDSLYSKKVIKLPITFSILIKYKCIYLYDVLFAIKKQNETFIHIDQAVEKIAMGIVQKKLLHVISKSRPIM